MLSVKHVTNGAHLKAHSAENGYLVIVVGTHFFGFSIDSIFTLYDIRNADVEGPRRSVWSISSIWKEGQNDIDSCKARQASFNLEHSLLSFCGRCFYYLGRHKAHTSISEAMHAASLCIESAKSNQCDPIWRRRGQFHTTNGGKPLTEV